MFMIGDVSLSSYVRKVERAALIPVPQCPRSLLSMASKSALDIFILPPQATRGRPHEHAFARASLGGLRSPVSAAALN
jgi:hypothetical protein